MYKPGIRYLIKFCLSYLVSETLNGTLTTQLKSWGGGVHLFILLFICFCLVSPTCLSECLLNSVLRSLWLLA